MTSGVSNVLCIGDTSSVIQIELLFLRNMDPEKNHVNSLYAIPRINFSLNVEKPKKTPHKIGQSYCFYAQIKVVAKEGTVIIILWVACVRYRGIVSCGRNNICTRFLVIL